jgi:hypothetical protein
MVVVEGLNRAEKDVTREKFITAIESIHEIERRTGIGVETDVQSGGP